MSPPLISGTAKVTRDGIKGHAGSAWLCTPGYALTAAHCVRSGDGEPPSAIALEFPWGKVSAKVLWSDPNLDAALLSVPAADLPLDLVPLPLGALPAAATLPAPAVGRRWNAYGFPMAHPDGLHLTGEIVATEAKVDGHPAIQLDCHQGGYGLLQGSSGSPVCHVGVAVGLVRRGILNQAVIHATPLAAIVAACPITFAPVGLRSIHPLHEFPRGPRVEFADIPESLIIHYASLNDSWASSQILIAKAIRMRRDADRDALVPRPGQFPEFGYAGGESFWTDVFDECCRHGPRMIGALLYAQPDDMFPAEAKQDREQLLAVLRGMWGA